MKTTVIDGPGKIIPANNSTTTSKLSFMNRFTNEELVAIFSAAKTDVVIEIFLEKLRASSKVNLTGSDTIAGVAYLVEQELVTQERADSILGL